MTPPAPTPPAATPQTAPAAELPPAFPTWPVSGERVRIWEDDFRRLHVAVEGHEWARVRPRRVFPLSGKADYVSFQDEKNHEILMVSHLRKLDKGSRAALEFALEHMYYTAKILRVDKMAETMGVTLWEVLTDRGYAKFEVVDREQHIRPLPGGRYIIMDADGNRFEIEDVTKLDKHSQMLVYHET